NRRRQDAAARALDARLAPLQRWVVNGLVARTRRLVRLRDNGQHYLVKLLLPVRRLFAEFGLRWAARGWLMHPDDVFFLDWSELSRVATAGDPTVAGLDLITL